MGFLAQSVTPDEPGWMTAHFSFYCEPLFYASKRMKFGTNRNH